MNRRSFLKVAFAAGIATAIPIAIIAGADKNLPLIVGDGVHDDGPGLHAAINGEPFVAMNYCVTVRDGVVRIHVSKMYIGGDLRLPEKVHLHGALSMRTKIRMNSGARVIIGQESSTIPGWTMDRFSAVKWKI